MRAKFLLPAYFKFIGVALLVPGLILGCLYAFFDYVIPFLNYGRHHFYLGGRNFTDEVAVTLIICGCFFVGFSRLKNENRITQRLRLNALYWAMVVNSMVIIVVEVYTALLTALDKREPRWADSPAYYLLYSIFFTLLLFLGRYWYLLNTLDKPRLKKRFYLLRYPWLNTLAQTLIGIYVVFTALSFIQSAHVDLSSNTFQDIYFVVVVPCSLLCVLTREENEVSNNRRLKATEIAYFINYALFLLATWVVYNFDYLEVIEISLSSLPIIFSIVFYFYRKTAARKSAAVAAKTDQAPLGGT
jgi:hypothetical protein